MKKSIKLLISGIAGLLAILLIVLVRTVDVAAIGPADTSIGLSHLNGAFHDFFGVNIFWYKVTEVFGILALLVCAAFAVLGLWQLIQRKSIAKVDSLIIALGVLYAVVIALYALFEKVIINYRPVIMPDATEPEASFPSSHTMLICVVMGSTIMVLGNYIKNESIRRLLSAICAVIMAVTVIGRLICGVHWLTDILGGIFISVALLALFSGIISQKK